MPTAVLAVALVGVLGVLGVLGIVRAMTLRARGGRYWFTMSQSAGCLVMGAVLTVVVLAVHR